MKKSGKENLMPEEMTTLPGVRTGKYDIKLLFTVLFIFSGLYFFMFGKHILFYQENYSMFIFSGEYFQQFSVKPGGLLEYAGNFISQVYFDKLSGSVALALVFTLLAIIFLNINKKLFSNKLYSILFAILPSCLLIIIQTNFNWLMYNNLGFISVALFFLFSISSEKKSRQLLVVFIFPFFFYLAGGYSWLFIGMTIIYCILKKKVLFPVFLIISAIVSLLLFKGVLFLQPYQKLIIYPFPLNEFLDSRLYLYLLYGFIILYPALLKIFNLIRIKEEYSRTLSGYGVIAIFSLTFFIQSRLYDQQTVYLFRIEKLIYQQNWDGVIKLQESIQSPNMIAQYYYNIALSEKNKLCDRMFLGSQDFGTKTIMIPWDAGKSINQIFRGVYFFYTIGLINEAHRWAFESMVVQGYTPENIKLLIKTDLINGHYKIAENYINILKRTLHYRSLANKYGAMLYHPELVQSDPELGEKIKLQPRTDFPVRIKNPQSNIILLLKANPENKKAFEYKLAWYLLEKNIDGIVNEIVNLKVMGYNRIPRHIEEAALFSEANSGPLPNDFGGLKIDPETYRRFSQYEAAMMFIQTSKNTGKPVLKEEIKRTFWYYLDWK
jgi:hypothetical protein